MVMYNPLSPEVRENPYPSYRALREADPVFWFENLQTWVLTAYDDILSVLRDYAHFSSDRSRANNLIIRQMEAQQDQSLLRRTATILSADPPSHTRMRALVNKAFTPRVVEEMRPHIQEITDSLFDALPEPGRMDVMADLAMPLPVIVIAELLGVSPADRAQFKAWSTDIAGTLGTAFLTPDALDQARRSAAELQAYFQEAVEAHKRQPQHDLLSALIDVEEQGDLLSADELLATVILLLLAGNETTTGLIGNGILALLGNPPERRRLQDDPSLITSAVEELLRFDSPVQATSRVVTEPFEFRGKNFEPGHTVLNLLGAANRDPAQFSDPDSLDLARKDNRHIAFGYGIHFCLGAPLARVEGQIAINAILRRFADPELATEKPEWGNSFILRSLKTLPIESKLVSVK
jgi:pimeloyl-[acyl-carrier protein] synthase